VIVDAADLQGLRGTVAMVDGGFDPLHGGHVDYFRGAAELGAPVLCNVSPDTWVGQKHPPLLPQEERARVIDAIRYVAYVHLGAGPTADVLDALGPRFYVKGADWKGRLPELEQEVCRRNGTEIVYLDTVTNSSSGILREYLERASGAALS
jgi:FAD synthetase